jgi:hypothetical protein
MSLDQLESQIDELRAQAARLYSKGYSASNLLDTDPDLSDVGKQKARETQNEQASAKIRDLRKREKELIAAKKQSIEKRLFGLSSSDPSQIIAFRDAGDRAAKLTTLDEAREAYSRATLSGDSTLAAAILARALEARWNSIVAEYVNQNPSAREDLADLAKLEEYDSFAATLAYATL